MTISFFFFSGIKSAKGILCYGPPGTGKTLLVRYICEQNSIHLIAVSGPELLSPYHGASEEKVADCSTYPFQLRKNFV